MPFNRSTVGRLAKVSLQMNLGLILALLLGVFFVVSGYWVTYKVLRGEVNKANYHFLYFVGRVHDQEVFLLRAINTRGTLKHSSETIVEKRNANNATIYTGKASHQTKSFDLIVPEIPGISKHIEPKLAIGVDLTDIYNDFWNRSSHPAPQFFLLDPGIHIDIVLPAIYLKPSLDRLMYGDVQVILNAVRETIDRHPPKTSYPFVRWASIERHYIKGVQLLAYASMLVSVPNQTIHPRHRKVIAAAFLDFYEPAEFGVRMGRHRFDTSDFDSIDLVAPDGSLLLGKAGTTFFDYEDGFYLTTSGLVIKRSSETKGGWQALYRIGFERLVWQARWQLLTLAGLFGTSLLGGFWFISWYRRRIVIPARSDYSELRQNHDFTHSLLQTVPLAIAVLKSDELLICNSAFLEWLGPGLDLRDLLLNWPLFEKGQPQSGTGCLMLEGRTLHVLYAPTYYLNVRVLLCTFTDISSHRDALATSVYARHAAEAANAQKSRFVATVSHEIRTPLYGVLGTLELLGLTDLTPHQRAYLDTIDSSSELLLHVINDVLDMAKIESGQMLLEPRPFEPVTLVEELLRTFSDMAARKGLALYSCIQPNCPSRVIGDGQRLRQIIGNLLSNAIKFTISGHVAIYLNRSFNEDGQLELNFRVQDTGPGIDANAQPRLFDPFHQGNHQQHGLNGTGLGLPICINLCELMGATLRIESNVGEGTTFSVSVALDGVEEIPRVGPSLNFDGKLIEVRSPFPDLTDALCAWFEHYGARTTIDSDPAGEVPEVLLDMIPQVTDFGESDGVTVFARHDFSLSAQSIGKDILVNQHSMAAIFKAVSMAIEGEVHEDASMQTTTTNRNLGLRVLLAEDNPVNRALMREQLENIGCTVIVSENGMQALERLYQEKIDVILTDVNMPIMDGYVLTRTVRARGLALPIIGVTANALREEGEQCTTAGMNSWLSKPISIQGLYLCLERVSAMVSRTEVQVPLSDQLQVPKSMRVLFAQTIINDLNNLRFATQSFDAARITQLLHNIRSALSVAHAKNLLETSKKLEASIENTERGAMSAALIMFIDRIEAALVAHDIYSDD